MSITVHRHVLPRGNQDAPLVTAWTDYIPVLDKGFVRLEAALASDLDPVNSARVSFDGRSLFHDPDCVRTNDRPKKDDPCTCDGSQWASEDGSHRTELDGADRGLLNFLLRERHMTPTEHSFFRFEVKAPIFVMREWHRHRIGISINEQSGRYMQLEREFYEPQPKDFRLRVGKPGAYTFVPDEDQNRIETAMERINFVGNTAFDEYEQMLEDGVAMEIARTVLPVSTYSTMWYSMNPRSLMSFLSLRNAPNAQREIRAYAEVMEEIFLQVMPETAGAFVEHGRRVS